MSSSTTHVLERAVPAERRRDGLLAVLGRLLGDLHDRVQPRRAARGDMNVEAAGHLVHLGVNGRLARHAHQQAVLQLAGQQRLVDRIAAMRHAVDLDHRLPAGEIVGAGEIHERPLGHQLVRDAALQHELGLGGHADAVGAVAIGVGASAWAMVISSTPGGGAIDAASSTCGGSPMQMATGRPSGPLLRQAVSVPRRSTSRAATRVRSRRSSR